MVRSSIFKNRSRSRLLDTKGVDPFDTGGQLPSSKLRKFMNKTKPALRSKCASMGLVVLLIAHMFVQSVQGKSTIVLYSYIRIF
jgi:hypothetical protein